jgi:hypothetical protein
VVCDIITNFEIFLHGHEKYKVVSLLINTGIRIGYFQMFLKNRHICGGWVCQGKIKAKLTILATMEDRKLPKAKKMDC